MFLDNSGLISAQKLSVGFRSGFLAQCTDVEHAVPSIFLTLVSKSTTPSPGPVPETVAYMYKLPNLSNSNCGTPGPTRAG